MNSTSAEIESEVDQVVAVLDNRKIRDIEELTDVRAFIRALPEASKRIGEIIKEVNR